MNNYLYENNPDRRMKRKRSRRQARIRKTKSFILIGGCLAAVALAVKLTGYSPLHSQKQTTTPFSTLITNETFDTINTNDTDSYQISNTNNIIDNHAWSLILVNKWNNIPDDYEMELMELANGQKIDVRIYPALQDMFDTARNENIYPIVASGYRTTEKQQALMNEKIADYKASGLTDAEAKAKAEAWVAIPGTSEHQLGLGVDINADGIHSTGEEVYEWLDRNSFKFGFIRRYPEDKTEITGVINEPWHYRYVGIEAATNIYNQGICLEEYLD